MDKKKIVNVIEALSKIIQIEDDKKNELIEKFSLMDEQNVIKELISISYRVFSKNDEYLDYAFSVIRNINPSICPEVNEIKERMKKIYSNEVEGNMSLEENHQLVQQEICRFTKMLNESGIDYYIVGALPCFLKTNIPLFRYHDDIDIMINEDDIQKVAEIIETSGYKFHDDRFPSIERLHEMQQNKPPHTVLAQNPDNEFHLGFFTFRRENDNSITMREYSHREENNEVIVDVLERSLDPIGTSLRYDDTPSEYLGTTFRTSSVESVYHLKGYTKRPKDITDIQKLEPYVDKEKLEMLKLHGNTNQTFYNVDQPQMASFKR